jgi:hypothetical protein
MENYGIENVKPAFRIVGGVVTAVANIDSNKDGTIQGMEVFNAVQQVVVKAIADRPQDLPALRNELTDISDAEQKELNQIISDSISMPNPDVEQYQGF